MSANFESFWKCVTRDHDLPKSCTTRLVLDMTPVGYEPPTNNEAKGANEVSREADDAVDGEIHDEVHDVAIAAKNISPASEPQIPAPVTDHCGRVSSLDDDASSGSSSLDSEELQAAILQPYKHKPIPHCGRCNSIISTIPVPYS